MRRSSPGRGLAALVVVVLAAGFVAAAAWPEAAPPSAKARPVVIDTDMSADDWMAILFLLHRTDVSVKAITVSGTGVAHGAPGARNVIRLLDLEGRHRIPVAYGRATTYPGGHAFPETWRPAIDGMLGIELPPPSRAVSRVSAPKLIAKVAARAPVEILELGPPTNLAAALRATPGLGERITSITLMGGALTVPGNAPGNRAEWNVYADPVAADVVLRSGIPWTLVPLDATSAVPYNGPFFRRLGARPKTAAARFVYDTLLRQLPGAGLYFWDPFAAAVLVEPSVAMLGQRTIRIVTRGTDAGRTLAGANGTQVRVALEGSQERFEELFLAALNTPRAAPAKSSPKSSAAPTWANLGPQGGSLVEVAIHPTATHVVYAGSWSALFRSTDGGLSWRRMATPRWLRPRVALDPEDPRTVYAVGGAGVYRTQDGGASWIQLPLAVESPLNVVLAAVSPSSPDVLYAVSHQSYKLPGVWLWSSADAGLTWARAGRIQAAGKHEPVAVLVDPVQPAIVYVRVLTAGVFRSSDGGKTWEQAGAGLPVGTVSSLAVDPAKSGVLYAGTRDGRVFESLDYGRSWTAAARGLSGEVSGIAASAADGAVYAATSPPYRADWVAVGGGVIYRSADGRAPWRRAHRGLTGWYVASLAVDPTRPGRVLAVSEHGVFVTQDGGTTWAARVSGLVASNPAGLAVDPENPRVVFAAVERGIAVSRDGGRTWGESLDVRGKRVSVGPLLAVPEEPMTVYAVKSSHASPRVRWTLMRSRDAGRTWTTVGALPASMGVLVVDPSRPATLYGIRGYPVWPRGGIFRSLDGGRSWSRIYSAGRDRPAQALAVDPLDPSVLYVGLGPNPTKWWKDRPAPLLKSEDGGRTWQRLRSFGAGRVLALAGDPRGSGILYAVRYRAYGSELRVSTDGGRTWADLGRAPSGVSALLVDPARAGVVYAGTDDGVYVKVGDSKWRATGCSGSWVSWLAADAKAERLYAGVAGRGIAATRLPLVRR